MKIAEDKTASLRRLMVLTAALFYGLGAGSAAWADDTEVFFPQQVVTGGVNNPNILFLMDTSGSMDGKDGTTETRLRRVQNALQSILNDLSPNVNIGIGRLSGGEGGAILWPVSAIDSAASSVYPALANQTFNRASTGGTNEAQQITSTVTTSPGSLTAGNLSTASGTAEFRITRVANEAEEFSDTRVDTDNGNGVRDSGDIELKQGTSIDPGLGNGRTNRYVGLRYDSVSLPSGVTITSAKLRFTCSGGGETATLNNVDIRGHDVNNSDSFARGNTDDISDRYANDTNAIVDWDNVGSCTAADVTVDSPDVSGIVTEIRNRSGWNDGNPITFLISLPSSGGQRTMKAFQGGSAAVAPRLIISYSLPASSVGQRQFGLRFEKVDIPRGVNITKASILLRANPASAPSQNLQPLTINIGAESAGSASAFDASSNNVSNRVMAGTVSWSAPTLNQQDEDILTPELRTIVNSVVSRNDWCGGNPMVFTFRTSALDDALRSFASATSSSDLAPVLSLTYSTTDPALDTGCQSNSTTPQISASSDDAEELTSNSAVTTNGDDLELGYDGSNQQRVGVRFVNLPIPQGATIRGARIVFRAKNDSSGTLGLTIRAQNADDAATFTNAAGDLQTRNNAGTSATVSWSPSNWTNDATINTPELTAVVQEVVNRSGWSRGNDMAFIISRSTGTATRRAYSVNGSASRAPKLVVEYEAPPGQLTTRNYLRQVVEDFSASGSTPLPEMLYEAAQYYRGGGVYYGKTRGDGDNNTDSDNISASGGNRISHPATIDFSRSSPSTEATLYDVPSGCSGANYNSSTCAAERINGTAYYKTPLSAQECTTNNIVLLSDGQPNNTQTASITRMQSLVGKTCDIVGNDVDGDDDDGTCGKEIAEFLKTTDQSSLSGVQTVKTFTIGFANAAAGGYLASLAQAGGGEYYPANDSAGVVTAFRDIVASILDIGTTFVAPAVTVNTFNRLTNRDELYFALFRPQPETRWEGNLKRYKLGGSPVVIQDQTGAAAVDPTTGFFKKTARSFWSPTVDGDDISKGGVISQFTASRNFYTYTGSLNSVDAGSTTAPTAITLSSSASALHESNTALTKTLLGDASMTDADRTALIQFSRGIDINDDDADSNTTEARSSLGDPLHSEPLLITYGGTAAAPDISVFFGTNEGGLHAIDASTGAEHFTFVPQELLGNLKTYFSNSSGYLGRPYGVDGPVSSLLIDPEGDLKIVGTGQSSANKAFVYFGLRRGGRQYYALDVTDRTSPKLKWVLRGGGATGKYRELGQTWSRAVPAKIKLAGSTRSVIIFSGGYDENQDGSGVPSADSMGRALFIADADTGERLWWGGIDPEPTSATDNPDLIVSQMTYSTPASPKAVDIDGDGFIDRIYMTDIRGQVFRFILNPSNTGAANLASVRRIGLLGDHTAESNSRRFFNSPDVALIRSSVTSPFISVSLGSGHREKPLGSNIKDRFYVLRDPDELIGEDTSFLATDFGTGANLFDATSNAIASTDPTTAATALANLNSSRGFFVEFLNSSGVLKGEKIITESQTFNNKIFFASFEPGARASGQPCQASSGLSRFYQFSVIDGTPTENFDTTTTGLTTSDRSKELAQGGLPPNPTVLFPGVGATLPQEALVCIGPECFNPGLSIQTQKSYWIKRR